MPVAVGIDLGTTNSCVAFQENGVVKIIPNNSNSNVTPSWVTFASDGVHVGQEAKDIAHLYITNAVYEFKRLMGANFDDKKIQMSCKSVPYNIVDDDGIPKVEVVQNGIKKRYSPEELSSYILANLKDFTEAYIGKKIDFVVVTVPAYYNDFQRQATKNAAIMAGFKAVGIINEPTAAALAYSHCNLKNDTRNVLVYDFGGGTFDVSVVVIGNGECVVKATKGDSHLGGTDIDNNILNYIRDDFMNQFGIAINSDNTELRRLKNKCESVKKSLSGLMNSTMIELSNLSGKEYFSTITKEEFDTRNKDIFEKTLEITKSCLNIAGLSKNEIDEVVLVGGSSRNLKVQAMLKEYFGQSKISHGIHPDEAVAYGAAIHANNLLSNKSEVKDVLSMSLGIEVLDGTVTTIISHNTPIPHTQTKTFDTVSEATYIKVYQGESLVAEENFKLGSFVLENVNYSEIYVTFTIDSEGILKVTATSKVNESNTRSIVINVSSRSLTSKQMKEQTKELEQHRENEIIRQQFNENKWELEMLCDVVTENAKKNEGNAEVIKQCSDISEWLKTITIADKAEVDTKITTLQNHFYSTLG